MPAQYCTQCGSKHEYTLKPPVFCGSCGEVLNAQAAKEIKEKKTIVVDSDEPTKPLTAIEKFRQKRLIKLGQNDEDEGAEPEENETPIKAGTIEVNVAKVKKESLKSLAVGEKNFDSGKREPGLLSNKSEKQFLKDFKKLAGTSRHQ